jgi:hypothetical protein
MGLVMTAAAAVIGATASGCGNEGGARADPPVRATSAIVQGWTMTDDQVNTWGLIGIYHLEVATNTWFPRPCSAEVLRSMNGVSWVLTARHCVTDNHQIGGNVTSTDNLELISGAQLPILSAGQAPPDAAVNPSNIITMDAISDSDYYHDMALVVVNASWPALVSYPKGLWVGDPPSLSRREFNAFGYGVSDPNLDCAHAPYPSTTAGTARYGGLFSVDSVLNSTTGAYYQYYNSSSYGQWVDCGDSGGPDIAAFGTDDDPYDQIIGVHSTGAVPYVTVESAMVTRWVQDQMGGIFLYSNAQQMVNITNNAIGFVPFGDATATSLVYDGATKQIIAGGLCLGLSWGLPRTMACDGNDMTQQWNVLWNRWITNASNNLCLTALDASNVVVQTCDSTENAYWTFLTQNGW